MAYLSQEPVLLLVMSLGLGVQKTRVEEPKNEGPESIPQQDEECIACPNTVRMDSYTVSVGVRTPIAHGLITAMRFLWCTSVFGMHATLDFSRPLAVDYNFVHLRVLRDYSSS